MGAESSHQQVRAAGQWDGLVEQLQAWRRLAGEPSYSDISQRISERRQAEGSSEAAARVGRSTVYDAFRLGRARLNLGLVREICMALGVPEDEVEHALQASLDSPSVPVPRDAATDSVPSPLPDQSPVQTIEPARPATPAHAETTQLVATLTPSARPTLAQVIAVFVLSVALNLLGRAIVDLFHLPIYLDMMGTAVAAIALGPWRGALVAIITGMLGALTIGWVSAAFIPVAVAGALAWGYGVRRFGLGRSLPRFFALACATSLLCTLIAAPILIWVFDGSVGHDQDSVANAAGAFIHAWVMKVSVANLLTSFIDKTISSFVALVAISMMPSALRPPPGDFIVMHGAAPAPTTS